MKVILLKDVKKQGKKDDILDVSDGYAENFLIKNGLAVKYTDGSKKRLQNELETRALEEDLLVKKCQSDKEKIEKLTLTFKVKVGKNGKIFGTISSKQIAEELNKKGFNTCGDCKELNSCLIVSAVFLHATNAKENLLFR